MNNELDAVKDALRRVADRLDMMSRTSRGSQVQGSHSCSTLDVSVGPVPSTSQAGQQMPGTSGVNAAAAAVTSASATQEHRRLFAPQKKTVARGRVTGRGKGKRIPTCTLKFFCLSRISTTKPPTAIRERTMLLNAGLGEASIQFRQDANALECHQEIVARFPKLVETGYELLMYQRGEDAGFYNISSPHTAQRMRDAAGNAKIYIRPLQKDLDESVVGEPAVLPEVEDGPTVNCLRCGICVSMASLSRHIADVHDNNCDVPTAKRQRTIEDLIHEDSTIPDPSSREQAGIQQYLSQNNPDQVENLRELFPGVPVTQVESALRAVNGNIDEAASVIMLDNSTVEDDGHDELLAHPWESISGSGTESLGDTLDRMATKLTGLVLRIRIEEDDLLMQALPIYKDPKFDPTRPLNITFKNQPAVDTGGPKREFYTQLFHGLATSDGSVLPAMFEGEEGRLIPCYSSSVVYSGLMAVVGKMIAHSIVQCGVGFPFLSPVCYWYLITGDVSEAISYGNIEDVRDIEYAELIHRLLAANTNDEMSELANDEKTVRLLGDAGCSVLPSVSNQQLLVESLMLHTILSKRKVLLDQLRKGLQVLNVLGEASKRPLLFESLFVGSEENLTPEKLKASFSLPAEDMNEDQVQTMAYFLQFVDESPQEVLKDLLQFATGSMALPSSRKIDVKFDVTDGCIFTSTCTMELRLPVKFDSYKRFEEALKIVISRNEKKSFNAM